MPVLIDGVPWNDPLDDGRWSSEWEVATNKPSTALQPRRKGGGEVSEKSPATTALLRIGGAGRTRTSLRRCEKGSDGTPKHDLPEAESNWVTQDGMPVYAGCRFVHLISRPAWERARLTTYLGISRVPPSPGQLHPLSG